MSNSVLCAVDISDSGDDTKVLARAAAIAKLDGAQLDLITVIPDYGMSVVAGYFTESHHDEMVQHAKDALEKMAIDTLGAEANASIRHIVATGKAYQEILNTAEATNCDLIVIGAHAPDLADYLLGPNAARVVRHSTCSVYVVR